MIGPLNPLKGGGAEAEARNAHGYRTLWRTVIISMLIFSIAFSAAVLAALN